MVKMGMLRVWAGAMLLQCALSMSSSVALETPQDHGATATFGTLLRCEGGDKTRCLWSDREGRAVGSYEMMRQLMESEDLDIEVDIAPRRRLEKYVQYIEDVHRHAWDHGVEFPYKMGVNERHLYLDDKRTQTPLEFVKQELHASHRRRLEAVPTQRQLATLPATLDWCSTDNPLKKNVCTPVKSQNKCGSCWAFAASDAIEMAVAVNTDTSPLALSPQQFLDCSRRNTSQTFNYCWAEKGISGAAWLKKTMIWSSTNNGCDGGMTHGAFMDAGQEGLGLLSELVLPYTETTTDLTLVPGLTSTKTHTPKPEAEREKSCVKGSSNTSAMITGYEQAFGESCSSTSDSVVLLKTALQKQPISVAINSGSTFKDYKGGIYECPDNGDFPPPSNSASIDHAIVLVGYGSEGGTDYWILKNSYGFSWGEKGFLRLKMDSKLNCGVSVFPVIPTGATKGAAKLVVQGGGDNLMLGVSPFGWVAFAAAVTIATVVLTAVGVGIQRRRRSNMHKDAVMG